MRTPGAGQVSDGGNLHLLVEHRRDPKVPDVIRADRVLQFGVLGLARAMFRK